MKGVGGAEVGSGMEESKSKIQTLGFLIFDFGTKLEAWGKYVPTGLGPYSESYFGTLFFALFWVEM